MAKRLFPNLYTKRVGNFDYYVARFVRSGRRFERSLGRTDKVRLSEAKRRLARLLAEDHEQEEPKLRDITYSDAWRQALDDIALLKQWRSLKSRSAWQRSFINAERHLGSASLRSITTEHIVSALRQDWLEHPESASRCRMRLEALFAWARTRGYCDSNPAVWRGCVDQFLPPRGKVRRVRHHEAPSLPELQKAVAYCLRHPSPVSGAILFCIATLGRVSECLLARREEIVGDTWVMPPERRKDGKDFPHRVPLSALAREALAMGKDDGLLWTVTGKPLALDSPRLKLVMIVRRQVTMHGIRSTFRDWCALQGVPDVLAEKSLSHRWGSEVTEAYLRSDLLEQRRPVLESWASAVLGERALVDVV